MTAQPGVSLGAAAPEGGASLARPRGGRARRAPMRLTAARLVILVIIGGYLLLPLLAMLEFSTRGAAGSRSLDAWAAIGGNSALVDAIIATLEIAAATVLLMLLLLVPTMTWAQLRVPGARRVIEFICLLPLAIPAIVLVVGIAPIYRVLIQAFGGTPLTLVFVDVILVLPYAYRAIDVGLRSVDVATLADAARSLGASWPRVMLQIVVPNIRGGILSASVLTVALVLGEFTISSLLNFDTVQVVINLLGKRNAFTSVAVSLAALVFAFVLLFVITRFAPGSRSRAQAPEES
jgi:putative spermidine/putrescine transport system permease protein